MGKYPYHIMQKVRQAFDLEPDDTSMDMEINSMSRMEVFAKVLEWEGIIGYEYSIIDWVESIFKVDLGEED